MPPSSRCTFFRSEAADLATKYPQADVSLYLRTLVSQDPDTARLMGINVDRMIVTAFAVGAGLAAIAGVAYGLQTTNINFKMGFIYGLKAFTAAVLGGIGNIQGAVMAVAERGADLILEAASLH